MSRELVQKDDTARVLAIRERARNVVIDAGAGTGKTATIVERLVDMVAPAGDATPVSIRRIAAITFTRKAAGELRLRVRERLLDQVARETPGTPRATALRHALDGLDTSFIGTIHSFADRLLRLRPVEAQLSPSYEVTDDDEELVHETVRWLLDAVDANSLIQEFRGTPLETQAQIADEAIHGALRAGLKPETRETEFKSFYGLDALIRGFIRYRDVHPPAPKLQDLDRAEFVTAVKALVACCETVDGPSKGAIRVAALRRAMRELILKHEMYDPGELLGVVRRAFDGLPEKWQKGKDFEDDKVAWQARNAIYKLPCHYDAVLRPLQEWLATRLLHVSPIAVELYERVKARRRELDQLDLLEKLRDLLEENLEARRFYQGLFDHIFVDEFQDTDPLQAEVVLFLCEAAPKARRWDEVALAPGKLTIVGDPKQSIYRFRRADISMYDAVRRQVLDGGVALDVKLEENRRSTKPLVEWFNHRFRQVLGAPPADGRLFDPDSGQVFYAPLTPKRENGPAAGVRILSSQFADGRKRNIAEYRALEAESLAAHLRHLVASKYRITDPVTFEPRDVRFSDVAVLTLSTYAIRPLFDALDRGGVPFASRGGTLLLSDALHQLFFLGLRALADRDDGVAMAALLRPPFFSIDPADVLADRAVSKGWDEAGAVSRASRVTEAKEIIQELRTARHAKGPGTIARELLDRTLFSRIVALEPNGAQRLDRLRFLCGELDLIAAREGCDYDTATRRLREWVTEPVQLDPPHPVGADAVQVLTVHQAKGLEFPVVVWWDGRAGWDVRLQAAPWRVTRDGRDWMISIDGFEYATDATQKDREREYLLQERRRLAYVAATRARDLLIVPRTGPPDKKAVCTELLAEIPAGCCEETEPYVPGNLPGWATAPVWEVVAAVQGEALFDTATTRFHDALAQVKPRLVPVPVSASASEAAAAAGAQVHDREGRFGSTFGSTVHGALGLVIVTGMPIDEAVKRAAQEHGLVGRLDEAARDVARGLDRLRAQGLMAAGAARGLEYPVHGASEDGSQLLVGSIDFVEVSGDTVTIVDFKTDQPPAGEVGESHAAYAGQVAAYRELLKGSGACEGRDVRCALLFTADGSWHEV